MNSTAATKVILTIDDPSAFWYFYFGAVCLATLLYAVVLASLRFNLRTPPFNSTFFYLWLHLGVIDILTVTFSWTFRNSVTFGWINFKVRCYFGCYANGKTK